MGVAWFAIAASASALLLAWLMFSLGRETAPEPRFYPCVFAKSVMPTDASQKAPRWAAEYWCPK